jgi:hypothetical protein
MRRGLGGYGKSVCNARSGRGSNGSGSEQPVLWHVTAAFEAGKNVKAGVIFEH